MRRAPLLAPLLALGLALHLIGRLAPPAQADGPLTDEDRREIAWLEQGGHPLGDGRPLVRVTWKSVADAQGADGEWNPFDLPGLGFLVAEDEHDWTVQGAEPEAHVFPKRPKPDARPWRVEVLDATTFGRAFLGEPARAAPAVALERLGLLRGFLRGRSLGTCSEALLVARAVATRGEPALAHQILEAARGRLRERDDEGAPTTLLEGAFQEDALLSIWRILLRFDDGAIPRTALRDDLVAFLRRFARSSHAPTAEDLLRVLERMLREDAEHRAIDDAALAALPPEEQAREWVWRLRDQDGGQFMQPGSPSVFSTWGAAGREREDTPAHRLRALGPHAIPVLIETLTDERLTRTVGYWRNFHFSHYVVRYADAAREILEHITGYSPWRGTYTNASMFKDDEADEVQRAYRAWWSAASGFDAPLRRLVAAGPEGLAEAARALPDRDPGRVVSPAADAAWGSGTVWEALGVARERAIVLSTAVLRHSEHVRLRVAAAWMLLDLGAPGGAEEAVDAMVALWGRLGVARLDPTRGEHVAAFLAACGDPRAIRALAEGLSQRPAAERQLVLHAFATSGLGAVRGLSADGNGIREPWRLTGEAERLAESLLVERLHDLEVDPLRRIGRQAPLADLDPGYDGGRRLADLAVRVLAARWPTTYVMEDLPALPTSRWEELRKAFLGVPRAAPVPR